MSTVNLPYNFCIFARMHFDEIVYPIGVFRWDVWNYTWCYAMANIIMPSKYNIICVPGVYDNNNNNNSRHVTQVGFFCPRVLLFCQKSHPPHVKIRSSVWHLVVVVKTVETHIDFCNGENHTARWLCPRNNTTFIILNFVIYNTADLHVF